MRRFPRAAAGLALSVVLVTTSAVGAAQAAPPTQAAAATATPQQSLVTKIKTIVTPFYTDAQLSQILTRLAANVYDGKPLEATFDSLFPSYVLTPNQTLAVLTLRAGVSRDLGSTAAIDKSYAASIRSAQASYNQMLQKVATMKRSGQSKARCADAVYEIASATLTSAKVEQTLKDLKAGLTAKEWQSLRTHGSAMFLWNLYRL
ncbi:hypothetical protein ACFC1I_10030 [Microbacterium sp. NPDC056044]|uniref:hypothetical protein n=1 Tax=Microbacterium sp. NPDC056044 TaxID=3345690 RepID=UPI0035E180E3